MLHLCENIQVKAVFLLESLLKVQIFRGFKGLLLQLEKKKAKKFPQPLLHCCAANPDDFPNPAFTKIQHLHPCPHEQSCQGTKSQMIFFM